MYLTYHTFPWHDLPPHTFTYLAPSGDAAAHLASARRDLPAHQLNSGQLKPTHERATPEHPCVDRVEVRSARSRRRLLGAGRSRQEACLGPMGNQCVTSIYYRRTDKRRCGMIRSRIGTNARRTYHTRDAIRLMRCHCPYMVCWHPIHGYALVWLIRRA